ncbi:hypothetical protein RF11_00451 [Thelohanellus kitauei]|uniref:Uncharacterized protein n=1 Tax=Thelohanellus kitauei TaxID=669202 RepID=A0A0C2MJ24_THEKT|nr:hypothetical protein RF11_00451 [Thelohanellus kitauei]
MPLSSFGDTLSRNIFMLPKPYQKLPWGVAMPTYSREVTIGCLTSFLASDQQFILGTSLVLSLETPFNMTLFYNKQTNKSLISEAKKPFADPYNETSSGTDSSCGKRTPHNFEWKVDG